MSSYDQADWPDERQGGCVAGVLLLGLALAGVVLGLLLW